MKLLSIFPVFFYFFLVQNVLIDAASTAEALEDPRVVEFGSKAEKVFIELINMLSLLPGMSFLSENGKASLKMAKEVGSNTARSLITYQDKKIEFIRNLYTQSKTAVMGILDISSAMAEQMANVGLGLIESTVNGAKHMIKRTKDGIEGFSSFLKFLDKPLNSLQQMFVDLEKKMKTLLK